MSTAHIKQNTDFRVNKNYTDRKYIFDDPDVYQLDNIVEDFEDCMQSFHRFTNKFEYKVKFDRGKNGDLA